MRGINETHEDPRLGHCLITTFLHQYQSQGLVLTNIIVCIINALLAIFNVFSNLMYIGIYMTTPRLQRVSNMLLVNLALTDFLLGCVAQPLYIARKTLELIKMPVCGLWDVHKVLVLYLGSASVLNLVLISCDRYVATFMPLRYPIICSRKKMKLIMVCVWIFSGLMLSFLVAGILQFYVIICVGLITSVVFVVFVHCKMLHQAALQRRMIATTNIPVGQVTTSLRARAKKRKPEKTVLCIVACLLLCLLPTAGYVIYCNIVGYSFHSRYIVSPWTETLYYLNSSVNPIIYCWRNRMYRKRFIKTCSMRE